MKRSLLILTMLVTFINYTSGQVGIGSSPNPNSILDLSNNGNKYILMPAATSTPTSILLDSTASVIYFNGNLYFNNGTSVTNTLSPWDWDGTSTGTVSSPSGASVGIGVIPVSSLFRLQVADATSGVSLAGTNASIEIGSDFNSLHLEIDNNEIVVKNTAITAGNLHLQKEGGSIEIGQSTVASNSDVLRVNGNIDAIDIGKVKENGYDLLPAGAIIIWNKPSIPAGWALCDGGSYPSLLNPAILITTPDLRERFVVGAGGDNPSVLGSAYAIADNGGSISSAHTHNVNIAATSTFADGAHQHTGTTGPPTGTRDICDVTDSYGSTTGHGHTFTTGLNGAHSHSASFPAFISGSASVTENRPLYYACVYIMKL